MKSYRAYIFDLDGTLFRGDEPIPGAAETVATLRRRGATVRYLTNNSTRTRDFFAQKLADMGFDADPSEVYSSGIGTAKYLSAAGIDRVFMVGEPGLAQTLAEQGIETTGDEVQAVVVGLCKSFDYPMMQDAMAHIRAGARFVATNADSTYPVEGGSLIPGAGSIVAAIRTCSETEPFVVGKPNPYLVELVLHEAGVMPSEALVVGDRMDTDIESGIRAGCDTFLVLSGVTAEAPAGQCHARDISVLASGNP